MRHRQRLRQLQNKRKPAPVAVVLNWSDEPTAAQPGDVVRYVDVFGDGEGLRIVWSDGDQDDR